MFKMLKKGFWYYFRFQYSLFKCTLVPLTAVMLVLLLYMTLTMLPFFAQVQFDPQFEGFWGHIRALYLDHNHKDLYELKKLYGEEVAWLADSDLALFIPSKKLTTLAVLKNRTSVLAFALLVLPFIFFTIRHLFRHYTKKKSWKSLAISWGISLLVLIIMAGGEAYFSYSAQFSQAGIGPVMYVFIALALAYTTGTLFVIVRVIIDAFYIALRVDPDSTFQDDIIVLVITVPLLFVFGNGPFDLGMEAVAGVAPFLILKGLGRWWPAVNSAGEMPSTMAATLEELEVSWKSFENQFADSLTFLALFAMVGSWGYQKSMPYLSEDYRQKAAKRARREKKRDREKWLENINQRVRKFYLQGQKEKIRQRDLEILSTSPQKEHLHTLAAIYGWRGKEEKARRIAKRALATTPLQVRLLLAGKSPAKTEELMVHWRALNQRLWQKYKEDRAREVAASEIKELKLTEVAPYVQTAAVLLACRGEKRRARQLAKKVGERCFDRVEMLVEGIDPPLVERKIKNFARWNRILWDYYKSEGRLSKRKKALYIMRDPTWSKKFKNFGDYLSRLASRLTQSHNPRYRDTLAAFAAWRSTFFRQGNGNRKKLSRYARAMARMALAETPRRVELLLSGKKPGWVETYLDLRETLKKRGISLSPKEWRKMEKKASAKRLKKMIQKIQKGKDKDQIKTLMKKEIHRE